jgi:hypothetical protein
MLMLDKEDDNSIDKYKFYHLTDDDHLQMKKYNIHLKLTHVFIHKDLTFREIIKSKTPGPKPILFLIIYTNTYYEVDGFGVCYTNPSKYDKCNKCTIGQFYNTDISRNVGRDATINQNQNTRLKLYAKISYFHELIFYVREICKNEIPEDVIKYILQFI